MAKVADPGGVQWSVRRRRWFGMSFLGHFSFGGNDSLEGLLLFLLLLPFLLAAIWPFWFIAHGLGLKWVIVIERDGKEVGEEKVRGWRRSGRRVQEIAQSAAAGTWSPSHNSDFGFVVLDPPPRTELYLCDASGGSLIAQLELTDRTLRCSVKGKRGYARWLSMRLGMPDLKERLESGQQLTVFEFPHDDCDIWLPEWERRAYFQVSQGDAPIWILFFSKPGRLWDYQEIAGRCQQWREALGRIGSQH
jgi:hypothetical protein